MSSSSDEELLSSSPPKAPPLSPRPRTPVRLVSLSSPPNLYDASDNEEESSSSSQAEEEEEKQKRGDEKNPEKMSNDRVEEARKENGAEEDEYFKPIKKLRMIEVRQEAPSPPKPLTSFFIRDILSHKANNPIRQSLPSDRNIVRPWDLGSAASLASATVAAPRGRPRSAEDDSRSDNFGSDSSGSPGSLPLNASPLDALFEMTSKAFEGLDADDRASDPMRDHLSIFSSRQQPKKKRKSRTAFTNHQIFELEKRFLYQKYLAPADRDEIAQSLGLTNAQVITWFQNRRAKLKRDMEELKKDVDAAKVTVSRSILETLHDMSTPKDGQKRCDSPTSS